MREYIKSPTLANFIAYKRVRAKFSEHLASILKKQKRLGWKKYCSQFNFKTPTSEI